MDELEKLIARVPRPQPSEAFDGRIDALLLRPDETLKARHRRGVWFAGFASAAAIMLAVSFYLLRPDTTWAQVAAAVQSKPWIRLKTTAESKESREIWFSFPRDVGGWRLSNAEQVWFTDYRAGVKYEYDPKAKSLTRLPVSAVDAEAFQSLSAAFRALFRGEDLPGDRFADDRIVGRQQHSVEENGQKWLEYELKLERGTFTSTLIIRIQPETKLPVSMRLKTPGEATSFDINYPAEGPADIYALGVPRDTPIDDRMPPADLAEIIRSLNMGCRDLDDYFAVVSGYLPERFVWRKGDKWRVDLCTRPVLPEDLPKDEAKLPAWWREHLAGCNPLPLIVCDGRSVQSCAVEAKDGQSIAGKWKVETSVSPGNAHAMASSFGNAGHNVIELQAYPQIGPSPRTKITVDPAGPRGPEGSVLVEINHDLAGTQNDGAYRTQRFWLDPKRQYVALKSEASNCPVIDRDPTRVHKDETYEFDEFRQSPRGVWYPTLVRRKHAGRDTDKDGVVHYRDMESHFFLDFSVALPDELFTPTTLKPGT